MMNSSGPTHFLFSDLPENSHSKKVEGYLDLFYFAFLCVQLSWRVHVSQKNTKDFTCKKSFTQHKNTGSFSIALCGILNVIGSNNIIINGTIIRSSFVGVFMAMFKKVSHCEEKLGSFQCPKYHPVDFQFLARCGY